jgi:hypothetical protein
MPELAEAVQEKVSIKEAIFLDMVLLLESGVVKLPGVLVTFFNVNGGYFSGLQELVRWFTSWRITFFDVNGGYFSGLPELILLRESDLSNLTPPGPQAPSPGLPILPS